MEPDALPAWAEEQTPGAAVTTCATEDDPGFEALLAALCQEIVADVTQAVLDALAGAQGQPPRSRTRAASAPSHAGAGSSRRPSLRPPPWNRHMHSITRSRLRRE